MTSDASSPDQDAEPPTPNGEEPEIAGMTAWGAVLRPTSAAAGAALAVTVRGVGLLRPSTRPLHPRGRVVRGVLHRRGASPPLGVPWLDGGGEQPVLVRVSRGGGLPSWLPDVLGLALRIDPDGARPADLLFATTGGGRLTRFLLAPTWRTTTPMSTLMPFRTSVGPVVLGARRTDVDVFELRCATLTGPWRRFASVRLVTDPDRAPEGEQPDLAFDPLLHQLPGLVSYDWARRLREPSYAAARAGRPTDHGRTSMSETRDPIEAPEDRLLDEDELADEMSEESFPGSDPPSTWAGPAS